MTKLAKTMDVIKTLKGKGDDLGHSHTAEGDGSFLEVGKQMEGWYHSDWGPKPLTNLPGVYEFLQRKKINVLVQKAESNLLADVFRELSITKSNH